MKYSHPITEKHSHFLTKQPHLIIAAVFALLIALPIGLLLQAEAQTSSNAGNSAPDAKPATSNYRLSGPYTHKNLTIFLVHGNDLPGHRTFLTLQEALAQKKVIVYETKDVNELAIRNLSNQEVYIQSGDVLRGGEQDRMISIDFIVPPRSRRIPIAAFCVESDRWEKRGNEKPATFSSSDNTIATKDLKLAAKKSESQTAVWENVKVAQARIASNVNLTVLDESAPSSYEMAVNNSIVVDTGNEYVKALSRIVRNKPDVIGYVFAINDYVNSADVMLRARCF